MIKQQYSRNARRARNIIWNAAGRYDIEPPFMAFFPNGAPDHYFNMVVGLTVKWLDMDRLRDFFSGYGSDRRSDEFDDYLWLGLENCVYGKEVEERPILRELRRQRAERFYEEQNSLSRQQMEFQSMPVYTQQEARWADVCGRKPPVLTPRERRMAEALRFSGELDTDGVLAAMENFLRTFFRYEKPLAGTTVRRAGKLAGFFLRHERRRKDLFLVRTGTGEGDHPRAVTLGHEGLGRYKPPDEEDEAYIRVVFGPCILPERDMRILNNELCADEDAGCRLWVSAGKAADTAHREASEIQERRQIQQEKSREFFGDNSAAIQSAVRALSTKMETIFSSYLRHQPEPARAGRICPEKAYRLPLLQDGRVFLKAGEETEQEIFVDILLDASQSRMNCQEVLSAEAYIVAASLVKNHVPVRVWTFRSLRGYTVLEQLKSASGTDCRDMTRYYAGGWNRDSLALRAAARMDDDPALQGKKRILLIMTDASPNDSAPITVPGRLLSEEYGGAAAVKAAERAVREIRERGIRVGAVFHGSTAHLEDLNQIYGHASVRIRKPSQLAQGVSDLLLMLLREMRND